MEIISEVGNTFVKIMITLFLVGGLFLLIGDMLFDEKDKKGIIVIVLGVICVVVAVIMIPICAACNGQAKQYRLRVDDKTTVTELKEAYDIVVYDPDTDLWIVKEKEKKDE